MTTPEAIRRRQNETNILLIIVLVVVLGAGGWQFFHVNPQNAQIQHELERGQSSTRRVLFRSCEDSGNPLRLAVQQILRDEIKQSRSPTLDRFFPQIPPALLHRLIHKQNVRRRAEIARIAPVDCQALYAAK